MRYIDSPSQNAYFNMALEEYVFERLPKDEQWCMLWQNARAVVVGKYQNTAGEINTAFVEEQGIQVVRRLSGGGAMYQDLGNLNFTFVVDQQKAKALDFELFIAPVVRALRRLGAPAEKNGRNDIVIDGRKISGNAQYNKNGRTMHHGTLLFCSDLSMLGRVLQVDREKIASKGVPSVGSRVGNISAWLPAPLTMADFKQALVEALFEGGGMQPYALGAGDIAAVRALEREKYATWAWNYGCSPAYTQHKKRRFAFGGVQLLMQVDKGVLQALAIRGDFFGNGEVAALEQALAGVPLQAQAVRAALAGVDVAAYIHGMDGEKLAELLLH